MQVSNAEWKIMKVLWMRPQQTSAQLIAILSDKYDWSASTIKTMLSRLLDKRYISREKIGSRYAYSALLTGPESREILAEDVAERTCAKNIGKVIQLLLENNDFTQADLDAIQTSLDDKRSQTVDSVTCRCL